MAAFAEMGLAPALISAIEDQGWQLPTPIQTEAIPLILGGGDVMAAAETGSGKTGAFALPVLQIVHETIASRHRGSSRPGVSEHKDCVLSIDDRDPVVAIAHEGLRCQARHETSWGGVRGTVGISKGKVYYEARVADEGLCRVGWSVKHASLDLGTQTGSFGYGGTGKKSRKRQFEDYGKPYGQNDVIGCLLDWHSATIAFTLNGQQLGVAFELDRSLKGQPLYPAICLKNAELVLNFGEQPFAHRPPAGFVGVAKAPADWMTTGAAAEDGAVADAHGPCKPTALILEPAKDLAEQTAAVIAELQGRLAEPAIRSMTILGGEPINKQARELAQGMDIVTGTPGRLMDLIESGKLATEAIKFFVLDEADRLLDTGNLDTILKMFARFPKGSAGAARLQVLMFSATLHSEEIRTTAAKICQNPILVDLKGKEAIPEAVDHVQVPVDPREDRSWLQNTPAVPTDNAHAFDATGPQHSSRENWSQGVKRLKPRILQRLIDQYKMDQCLIFCRTNFDCDNLESFLNGLGGGGAFRGKMERGKENPYSCLVLAGQRSMEERRAALQAFKDGDIRFLICTDVAARGIDISGLPFLINMTLPDRTEDYIHRVGRVGRAQKLGLAISLVSQVEEKVWYCRAKGQKPWLRPTAQDVTTHEEGGHTIWYRELQLLKEIEERLKHPVEAVTEDLSLPRAIMDRMAVATATGQAAYGEQRSGLKNQVLLDHQEEMRPAVAALAELERQAQVTFFDLTRFGAKPTVVAK